MTEPNRYEAPQAPTGEPPSPAKASGRADRSYVKALAYFLAATSALVFLVAGRLSQAEPEGQGEIIGRILVLTLIPAIVVGVVSRRSAREYGWVKFGASYLFGLILVFVLTIRAGR